MNELEARRLLLADPRRITPSLQAQLSGDARLAMFRDELLEIDSGLLAHVTRAPVPDGLAERIVLRARYRGRSRWNFALAASVAAFAIALSGYFALREPPLERVMFDHVAEGTDELADNPGIEPAVLRVSVATLGVQVRDAGYHIRHLANCIVAGREGRHFTVDGPNGVVSFLVLPGTSGEAPVLMQEKGLEGLFMKHAGLTIGVFAQQGTSRADLEKIMQEVVG